MTAVLLAAFAGAGVAAVAVVLLGALEAWWHPEHRATARLFEIGAYRPRSAAVFAPLFLPHDAAVVAIAATAVLGWACAASWLTIMRLIRNLSE